MKYVATIQLVVDAESEADACDLLSGLLSETPNSGVYDWGYLRIGGQRMYPHEIHLRPDHLYEEGEFLE